MAGKEDSLVVAIAVLLVIFIILCAIPSDVFFLGFIVFRPFEMLPTMIAIKLVFIFHCIIAPWTYSVHISVSVDTDLGHGLRNAECMSEQ